MDELTANFMMFSDSWMKYILAFLESVTLAYFFQKINRKVVQENGVLYTAFLVASYILIALPVALVIGLRGPSVGFDTYNYLASYKRISGGYIETLSDSSNRLEWGFVLIRWLAFKITNGAIIGALFPMTLLTIIAVLHTFVSLGKRTNIALGLFLFYACFGLKMCDQARQLLAVAILGIAVSAMYKHKTLSFFIWIMIAASVHTSALIGAVLIIFMEGKVRSKLSKFIFTVSMVLIAAVLFRSILQEQYSSYTEILTQRGSAIRMGAAWILDLTPVIVPMILVSSKTELTHKLKLFSLSAVIFRLIGYVSYFIMRMYYYPAFISWIVLLNAFNEEIESGSICRRAYKNRMNIVILVFVLYFVINYIYLLQSNVVPYISIN